jgi:RimJ/RimL family protein N-acetyltransferase
MNLVVTDQVSVTDFRPSDKSSLIQHLSDKDIYDRTLRIPYPFTESDANEWLALVAKATREQGQSVQWAIRNRDGMLTGVVSFDGLQVGKTHRGEIGYWLAKPFWGQGTMTAVVQRACQHAFEALGLMKITAHVFAHNLASCRVLEKCGFQQEGFLRKHYLKDGHYLDVKLYALLR